MERVPVSKQSTATEVIPLVAKSPFELRVDLSQTSPEELTAALPHAPSSAVDRRQRPIPWWRQWLEYLEAARGHGGVRVH